MTVNLYVIMVSRPQDVKIRRPQDIHLEKQLGFSGISPREVLYATNGRAKSGAETRQGSWRALFALLLCFVIFVFNFSLLHHYSSILEQE